MESKESRVVDATELIRATLPGQSELSPAPGPGEITQDGGSASLRERNITAAERSLTPLQIKKVIRKQASKAIEDGDTAAAKLVLDTVVGKAVPMREPQAKEKRSVIVALFGETGLPRGFITQSQG